MSNCIAVKHHSLNCPLERPVFSSKPGLGLENVSASHMVASLGNRGWYFYTLCP